MPRQTEGVGRQHQGMDRRGVCQVPDAVENREKMEETGCDVICGALTTLAVKGQVKGESLYSLKGNDVREDGDGLTG